MTKADVVNEISVRTGLEKNAVADVLDCFFLVTKNSMESGNNLYFRGFGTFELKLRKKKVARNIKKNTSLIVPEHYIAKFKPAKEFSEKIKTSKVLEKKLSSSK